MSFNVNCTDCVHIGYKRDESTNQMGYYCYHPYNLHHIDDIMQNIDCIYFVKFGD